jgi:hypothetical protein
MVEFSALNFQINGHPSPAEAKYGTNLNVYITKKFSYTTYMYINLSKSSDEFRPIYQAITWEH